mgnify:CR=1 FL=1
MDNRVYVVKCGDYAQAESKISELLGMMGGMNRFVGKGEEIALKVNLLREARPDEAVSTHPAMVAAVARMVMKEGARPLIVDSPGSGFKYTKNVLEKIYHTNGMSQAAEDSGAELNFDTSFENISFPEGELIKRFEVITPVLKADGMLNLCKLKTHSFTHMTGAIKNHFGVIPGRTKPGYHAKLADKNLFVDMLLDLMHAVPSRISIMDAVMAMEGDGPGTGDPRKVGLFLGAENALALDVVAGEIMGLHRENNPFLMQAEKRGIRPNRIDHVELVGAPLSELKIPGFKFPPTITEGTGVVNHLTWWQKPLQPIFKDSLTRKPRILKKKCIACAACYQACPVKAISMVKNSRKTYAEIDESKCIRCYCCHEMCAEEAIILKTSLFYRLAQG